MGTMAASGLHAGSLRWIAAVLVAAGLAACGGGGGDDVSEEASWVRIDAPLDGETIHA